MELLDKEIRKEALDISKSFLIKAPAGSGKTSILILRILNLLAKGVKPQNILATTFTKKAAYEMKQRLISALNYAEIFQGLDKDNQDKKYNNLSSYKKDLLDYSLKAYKKLAEQNIFLMNIPSLLNISTMDAFASYIVKKMPKFINETLTFKDLEENSFYLYNLAVDKFLDDCLIDETLNFKISKILISFDNNIEGLKEFFIKNLQTRHLWINLINEKDIRTNLNISRKNFKEDLENEAKEIFSGLENTLKNSEYEILLNDIFSFLNQNGIELASCKFGFNKENVEFLKFFLNLFWKKDSETFYAKNYSAKNFKALGIDTSTKNKSFNKIKNEFAISLKNIKNEDKEFIDRLYNLKQSLEGVLFDYENFEFENLVIVFELFKELLSRLMLVFEEHRSYDFIEQFLQAIYSLGGIDEWSNISESLENNILHLLIDEFQDISLIQKNMIQILIRIWTQQNNKTVFIVGDVMQSIYSFRNAEPQILNNLAKNPYLEDIKLNVKSLNTNFRSNEGIINFVNKTFLNILESRNRKDEYTKSYGVFDNNSNKENSINSINSFVFENYKDEANFIIQELLKIDKSKSVGILIKSRDENFLNYLCSLLFENNIAFNGIETFYLNSSEAVQTLSSLSFFLSNIYDELSLIEILRSKIFGLSINDIFYFKKLLQNEDLVLDINNFTENLIFKDDNFNFVTENNFREKFFYLKSIIFNVDLSLFEKLSLFLKNCNIYSLYKNEEQNIGSFLNLVKENEVSSKIIDTDNFKKIVKEHRLSILDKSSNIEIMTIHKAKGLEFDIVFLPNLNKGINKDFPKVISFLEIDNKEKYYYGTNLSFIFNQDLNFKVHNYLKNKVKEKEKDELIRLYYVACTRAKSKLYLTGENTTLKENILHIFKESGVNFVEISNEKEEKINQGKELVKKYKLNEDFKINIENIKSETNEEKNILLEDENSKLNFPEYFNNFELKQKGISIHKFLELYLKTNDFQKAKIFAQNYLYEIGLINLNLEKDFIKVRENLENTKNGNFILSGLKADFIKTEFEIKSIYKNKVKSNFIDYIFLQNNDLFIIDFKTGILQNDFYEKQLKNYKYLILNNKDLKQSLKYKEIHTFLYNPLNAEIKKFY